MAGRCQQGERNGNYRHGHAFETGYTKTYSSWYGMVQRCTNPHRRYYHRYGGRGIKVCDRWLLFVNFLADMGPKPDGTSLDRIDNNGDYTKENCRWATQSEQLCNTSRTRYLTVDGDTRPLMVWCSIFNVKPSMVRKRLKLGWSARDALLEPPKTSHSTRRRNGVICK